MKGLRTEILGILTRFPPSVSLKFLSAISSWMNSLILEIRSLGTSFHLVCLSKSCQKRKTWSSSLRTSLSNCSRCLRADLLFCMVATLEWFWWWRCYVVGLLCFQIFCRTKIFIPLAYSSTHGALPLRTGPSTLPNGISFSQRRPVSEQLAIGKTVGPLELAMLESELALGNLDLVKQMKLCEVRDVEYELYSWVCLSWSCKKNVN